MIETYSIWNLHGKQLDNASSSNATSNATRVDNVEPIVDPNEQVMDIINDVFPFASTNINQEGEDDVPTPMDRAEFEQYEKLLKNANQELYPGTKGYMACPVCKEDVTSSWHAGKVCYLGHRRWLPRNHKWREKDKEFDGNTEHHLRPREWSGDDILEQLNRLDFAPFRKTVSRTRPSTHMNWMHKSMFLELPYWSKLKLRHNLDVMHVEKNVFDTLMGTILDIEGKTKDTIKARLDLERMGIRRDFLKFASSVKFPDRYASNIARCVNVDEGKFTGLKSHDCHVFMQRLLPVGIRHLLPEDVVKPIMLLSRFFSQLTAKTLQKTDMFQLGHDIVQVLCKFEMIFPPAFFTSMIHVMVHLPEEALLAGPVNYHLDTAFNHPQRNNDEGVRNEKLSVFAQRARPFGDPVQGESFSINDMEVNKLKLSNSPTYSEELYNLAFGPIRAELFSGCHVNGIKFLGTARDDKLCTQNSSVHVPSGGERTDIDFYGKLTTVVQLLYKDRYQQNIAKQIVYLHDPKAGSGWKVVQQMDQRNVYAIPELDPTENDVPDQRLESSMENDAETLRDTNVIQEPFQVQGVSSIEIPIQSITIDLGDLPRYDVPVGPNYESDEEEDWETESDDSDDNEGYYSSDNE
ncbi:unnamed protein product [Prunus armeniaca]